MLWTGLLKKREAIQLKTYTICFTKLISKLHWFSGSIWAIRPTRKLSHNCLNKVEIHSDNMSVLSVLKGMTISHLLGQQITLPRICQAYPLQQWIILEGFRQNNNFYNYNLPATLIWHFPGKCLSSRNNQECLINVACINVVCSNNFNFNFEHFSLNNLVGAI